MGQHRVEVRIIVKAILGDIGDIHRGLSGQKMQRVNARPIVVIELQRSDRLGLVELRQEFILEERLQGDRFFIPTLCRAHNLGKLFFTGLEVSQCQLSIDGLNIRERIDLVRYMNDVGIFKAANDVGDGIRLTNIG